VFEVFFLAKKQAFCFFAKCLFREWVDGWVRDGRRVGESWAYYLLLSIFIPCRQFYIENKRKLYWVQERRKIIYEVLNFLISLYGIFLINGPLFTTPTSCACATRTGGLLRAAGGVQVRQELCFYGSLSQTLFLWKLFLWKFDQARDALWTGAHDAASSPKSRRNSFR
jgi:hypothetical protein